MGFIKVTLGEISKEIESAKVIVVEKGIYGNVVVSMGIVRY